MNGTRRGNSSSEASTDRDTNVDISAYSGDEFDLVIGCIEDVVVGDSFARVQDSLLDRYAHHFDAREENKLVYTEVFREYTGAIERLIEVELETRIPGFRMREFLLELVRRRDHLDGDVFEMLYTLTDFVAFKEMFVDYNRMKGSGQETTLQEAICVTPINSSLAVTL